MSGPFDEHGFAPDYDSPIPYMQRTRDYYTAIGYTCLLYTSDAADE